jgi:hypothetical protein
VRGQCYQSSAKVSATHVLKYTLVTTSALISSAYRVTATVAAARLAQSPTETVARPDHNNNIHSRYRHSFQQSARTRIATTRYSAKFLVATATVEPPDSKQTHVHELTNFITGRGGSHLPPVWVELFLHWNRRRLKIK